MAECIPTLTGAVLTSPMRVTFLVWTLWTRVGRVSLPTPVLSVGMRSLSITAAPLELDMFAIMASCFPGRLSLKGPIARTSLAERRTVFLVNTLFALVHWCSPALVPLERNGLTRDLGPVLKLVTSFLVTIRLFPVFVLGFTLTI